MHTGTVPGTATCGGIAPTLDPQEVDVMESASNIEIVGCPQCGAPAEVTDRFVLASTDGPVELVKVHCVLRHWFTVLLTDLPAPHGVRR